MSALSRAAAPSKGLGLGTTPLRFLSLNVTADTQCMQPPLTSPLRSYEGADVLISYLDEEEDAARRKLDFPPM